MVIYINISPFRSILTDKFSKKTDDKSTFTCYLHLIIGVNSKIPMLDKLELCPQEETTSHTQAVMRQHDSQNNPDEIASVELSLQEKTTVDLLKKSSHEKEIQRNEQ